MSPIFLKKCRKKSKKLLTSVQTCGIIVNVREIQIFLSLTVYIILDCVVAKR